MRAALLLCLLYAACAAGQYSWDSGAKDVVLNTGCNVDQPSCACCKMVQDTNKLKAYFNAVLTGLEQDLSQTNQSLQSIEANRVAFSSALYTNNNFRCNGPFSVDSVIVYKQVFINYGNSYNVDTGIFTAPCAGVYSLAVSTFSDSGASGYLLAVCITLQVNSQVVAGARDYNTRDKEDSSTIAIALSLKVGDKVSVNLAKNCFLCDDFNHYNTFSAFLLYATA
ncbi:complement C1q tumor necrosis factor-related protein 3 [Nothobranchius furzeri]|uniref:Complement C1q-like protein 4 n=1 Tax=Nothobranchius furzeri TaxID=105023 RepID=A0A8C6LUP2_NOTFU|nr:complement C1q-like protein 4 [Nothobranchius furzeri]KAF7219560.1 complement C1q-like protein 4 [Nothobranchius furzeri]